jgi:hypothetical protein
VERRVDLSNLDLDRAAVIVAARRAGWRELGLVADELIWMDNDASWPVPLLRDRGQASRPMSVGVRVQGDAGEAEFVLYAGGWADVIVRNMPAPRCDPCSSDLRRAAWGSSNVSSSGTT